MLLYLPCECGKKIPVGEGAAGTSILCECRPIKVPSLGELRQRVTDGEVLFFPTQVPPPPHPLKRALGISERRGVSPTWTQSALTLFCPRRAHAAYASTPARINGVDEARRV
jgi:hypothetical protein